MKTPACSCGGAAELVTGSEIYPHRQDLHHKPFWRCDRCAGYVGCHPGTQQPLGTPADAELRKLRMQVHELLDPMWQGRRRKHSRSEVYQWLAVQLCIEAKDCHVGMFDKHTARRTIEVLRARASGE